MKKIVSLALIFTLLLGILSVIPVSALTISSGDFVFDIMEDDTLELVRYNGNSNSVVIPSKVRNYSVTSIADEVFKENRTIETAVIPEGVTKIGISVFYDCTNLTKITLPDTLKDSGEKCFYETKITELKIPKAMTKIPDYFCYGAKSLSEITATSKITEIGEYSFCKTKISDIDFLDSVEIIGDYAFSDCNNLNITTLPSTVTTLGDFVFAYCSNIKYFIMPKNITSCGSCLFFLGAIEQVSFEDGTEKIFYSSFSSSNKLTTVYMPNTIKEIETEAFENCKNLKTVNISENIEIIGDRAFDGAISLKRIKLPNTIKILGEGAFQNSGLTSIRIPASLESCGKGAFQKSALISVVLEEGLTEIFDTMFLDCVNLDYFGTTAKAEREDEYSVIPSTVTKLSKNCFSGCKSIKAVKINSGLTEADYPFKSTSIEKAIISNGATQICDTLFADVVSLTEVEIPESVKIIGEYGLSNTSISSLDFLSRMDEVKRFAFSECDLIKEAVIPASLICRGYIFSYSGLEKITFEEGRTEIPEYICARAKKLQSVLVPSDIKRIENGAFGECTSLSSFRMPYYLEYIGVRAFEECTSLKSINVPANLKDCSTYPFNNSGLETVKFANGCKSIPRMIFANCKSLKSVTIPEGVENINISAFANCTSLTSITIPSTVNSCNYPFENSGLVSVTFAEGTTYIPPTIFVNCKSLKNISFPDSVYSIGSYSFKNCDSLTSIILPKNLIKINSNAFFDCDKLRNITIPKSITKIGDYSLGYKEDGTSMGDDFTIYGYSDTAAKTYAYRNGFNFVPLEYQPVLGDISCDSIINISDATLLQLYLSKDITLKEKQLNVSDVDKDGNITVNDVTTLQSYLAKIITVF